MSVTLIQAQADLAGLIHSLPPGGQMVVTENDQPVATITAAVPTLPGKRIPGLWKDKLTILADDEEHLADFAEYMA